MMHRRTFGALFAVSIANAFVLPSIVSCSAPPAPPPKRESVPQWQDIFEGTPDIYAVIRPKALKRDSVYGSFWQTLMRVAQSRGVARGATMAEALEGSEEIIIGLNRGDAAMILRGVPANLDPQTILDPDGKPLFQPVNDRAKVLEYEVISSGARKHAEGSLFILPDRTWVGALGETRNRARRTFASPLSRPAPEMDKSALVAVRFAGPFLQSFEKHPTLGVFTKHLQTVTFALQPGKVGLAIELAYDENSATALAEMHAKRYAAELAKDDKRFGWVKDAKVQYEGNTVIAHVAIPPRLLEELPNVSGADLGF